MFIETEATPNPDTVKFLPGRPVMENGTAHFQEGDDLDRSPLAAALMDLPSVVGVFLGADYVSVSKSHEADWDQLKARILASLMQFFASGAPIIVGEASDALVVEENADDAEIIDQIRQLLDEKVRPAVAGDGGDIVYRGFSEGIVYLQMQGACQGCPSASITLKHGIENLLKYYVPEVVGVRPVE